MCCKQQLVATSDMGRLTSPRCTNRVDTWKADSSVSRLTTGQKKGGMWHYSRGDTWQICGSDGVMYGRSTIRGWGYLSIEVKPMIDTLWLKGSDIGASLRSREEPQDQGPDVEGDQWSTIGELTWHEPRLHLRLENAAREGSNFRASTMVTKSSKESRATRGIIKKVTHGRDVAVMTSRMGD